MEVLWSFITGRPALGGSRTDGFSSSGMLAPPYFSWLYQCDWFYYGCHSSKHLSAVKCRKRTKSLACVPFKGHWELFRWPTMITSFCLISQGYSRCLGLCLSLAYKQDQHDWLKLIIIYYWSLDGMCAWLKTPGGRENMQTSASKERRGWEDPLVAQHYELPGNLTYMRSIHVWLERFGDDRLLCELSWIPHGSNQQCCHQGFFFWGQNQRGVEIL